MPLLSTFEACYIRVFLPAAFASQGGIFLAVDAEMVGMLEYACNEFGRVFERSVVSIDDM